SPTPPPPPRRPPPAPPRGAGAAPPGGARFRAGGLPVTQVPLGRGAHGLPLGVQVVAGAGRDHLSIAAALTLQDAFGGWVRPRP
ncbi:amidase, partial [Nocardia sp. NPDC058497]